MTPSLSEEEIPAIIAAFQIEGRMIDLSRVRGGHLNVTYCSTWESSGGTKRFIHQRVNEQVFQDIPGLMCNIDSALQVLGTQTTAELRTPSILRTAEDALFTRDASGEPWRSYSYVEDTYVVESCPSPAHAAETGRILGVYHRAFSDCDVSNYIETISGFQNLAARFDDFEIAVSQDRAGRLGDLGAEVDCARQGAEQIRPLQKLLSSADIPKRITHGDPKITNVLFDSSSDSAVCLVDFDTIMPGSLLYDFGDLARSLCVPVAEDEADLSAVVLEPEFTRALIEAYVTEVKDILVDRELEYLARMPEYLAITLGTRFLTDHLNGDSYFHVDFPGHNLQRTRTQYAIARLFHDERDEFSRCIEQAASPKT